MHLLVRAAASGHFLDAAGFARSTNPLSSTCGRVCEAPCEAMCVRANLDDPVSIRALERTVNEEYGPESQQPASFIQSRSRVQAVAGAEQCSVAVVGAGPAGLACAESLARSGFRCTLFEREPRPGGDVALVPAFRLPQTALEAEIDAIVAAGVELRCEMEIDPAAGMDELLERFDAVCWCGGLPFEGGRDRGYPVTDFLRDLSAGRAPLVDVRQRRVVVLSDLPDDLLALDAARTAIRLGAWEAALSPRPSAATPYMAEQIAIAEAEGVLFALESDVDTQESVTLHHRLVSTERQHLPATPAAGYATHRLGLYIAGRARTGWKPFVYSIGDGISCAREVVADLAGHREHAPTAVALSVPLDLHLAAPRYYPGPRLAPPDLEAEEAKKCFLQTELAWTYGEAVDQAARCLDCGTNTRFIGERCIACARCVDVCPEAVIELHRQEDAHGAAVMKLDARCIRCGLCELACPTDAVKMVSAETSSVAPIPKAGGQKVEQWRLAAVASRPLAGRQKIRAKRRRRMLEAVVRMRAWLLERKGRQRLGRSAGITAPTRR